MGRTHRFFALLSGLLLLASCQNAFQAVQPSDLAASRALASGAVVNGIQWADTAGNPLHAHGGGFIKSGSYYYWFGENRNLDYSFKSVNVYRSTDLQNWEYRGNALSSTSAAELNFANIERPKVIYNGSTAQYVMWMHWENGTDYGQARAAVAYSSTVEGPYTYQGSFRPFAGTGVVDHGLPGYMSRDCNLFVDTDGKAYFISASNENLNLNLYELTADYRNIASLTAVLFAGGQREAPALFKRGSVYFLLTSGATGWSPNQAKYATSSSLASGWTAMTNVGDSTGFYSQPTSVITIQGTSTSYLYAGDRWAGAWSGSYQDSMYVWLPITFPTSTTMSLSWVNTTIPNVAAGTIASASYNFRFTNVNSGKVMEIKNNSTADGGIVDQYTSNGGNNQKWSLNYDGAGYFVIKNVNSGKALDVPSSSTADGVGLIQYTPNGGSNQKWRLEDKGGGVFVLKNKNSGKVAQVAGASTANVAVVEQSTATGASHQRWQMITQ